GRTILYSALLTIIVTVVMATLRKSTRMNITDIIGALEDGVRQTLGVAAACAAVGIIVGVVTLSGFGVTLAGAIVSLSRDSLLDLGVHDVGMPGAGNGPTIHSGIYCYSHHGRTGV